jgi:hypothetical protein
MCNNQTYWYTVLSYQMMIRSNTFRCTDGYVFTDLWYLMRATSTYNGALVTFLCFISALTRIWIVLCKLNSSATRLMASPVVASQLAS